VAYLDQEFISPVVQRFKALGTVDVVHQHTAVGAPVKRHTQRLETLLPCRVPDLWTSRHARKTKQLDQRDRQLAGGKDVETAQPHVVEGMALTDDGMAVAIELS
jgi:hypothetical protein